MDDDRGALSAFYPSETPALRGRGKKWVAILLVTILLGGFLVGFVMAFFPA